jgi:hypothetical protein
MELTFFLPFTLGVLAGGGLFGFGLLIGLLINRDTFSRQVKDEPFDPTEEVMNDEFFDDQWKSDDETEVTVDGEFPSDDILEELDRLHRHSEF